ncbi:7143_t:CDS:2 [Ambispora gerdemannii]|uniref:7143_t:CDS:1 n=1 Tax=Ambispora gerdemannii TaxID=144530 RepID=A0A9N9AH14_9GLOM|nr:7143_t:CDS:2 [Ambispora gerdemannii]
METTMVTSAKVTLTETTTGITIILAIKTTPAAVTVVESPSLKLPLNFYGYFNESETIMIQYVFVL